MEAVVAQDSLLVDKTVAQVKLYDRYAVSLLSLGYPRDRPLVPLRKPDRRPFDDVVHRGRW